MRRWALIIDTMMQHDNGRHARLHFWRAWRQKRRGGNDPFAQVWPETDDSIGALLWELNEREYYLNSITERIMYQPDTEEFVMPDRATFPRIGSHMRTTIEERVRRFYDQAEAEVVQALCDATHPMYR
jgi:hypothetical protein